MLERDIENYLIRQIKKQGWLCYKFTSPSRRSVPDRIILTNDGRVVFVECKAPGKKPTKAQAAEHEKLQAHQQQIFVVDSKQGVNDVITQLTT